MTNIQIIKNEFTQEEWVMEDKGNGEFVSTLKSTWDEQQKAAELGGTL